MSPEQAEQQTVEEITPQEAFTELDEGGVTLIDVREPDEYAHARVPGARLVPLTQIPEQLGAIPADQPIDIICRSGGRSQRAAQFLIGQGYLPRNVVGGTDAWIDAGYRVETGPSGE